MSDLDLSELTFKEDVHYNGGKEWFGYGWTCVQEPRITMIRRYFRKTRTSKDEWRLDGNPVVDAQAAVTELNSREKRNERS